jgi:hypothetical protein
VERMRGGVEGLQDVDELGQRGLSVGG